MTGKADCHFRDTGLSIFLGCPLQHMAFHPEGFLVVRRWLLGLWLSYLDFMQEE